MAHIDHISHARHGFKPFPDRLYVVTAVINPVRFRSRLELYHAFEKRVADAGAILHTVEVAFGDRPFEVTHPDNQRNLQLRTSSEIWHKENALNLLIARLPADWKYVAWVDADVLFSRPDWAQETLHQLQHFDFVQLFSHAQDLGPDYEPITTFSGFAFSHVTGEPDTASPYGYYTGLKWHPGYAWAARRSALDQVGGLIDKAILGSADRHMAAALIGKEVSSYHPGVSDGYKKTIQVWADRAKALRKNIGYVPGMLQHHWHGPKSKRGYSHRWKVLVDSQYHPDKDLKRDTQGLFQLTPRSQNLRDDIRRYFRSRNEDSIDR
jgi:hypothetical protein